MNILHFFTSVELYAQPDRYLDIAFQTDEAEVINFLLTTEIIPLCLRIMESGSELSKTVSDANSKDLILLAHYSSFQLENITHINFYKLV